MRCANCGCEQRFHERSRGRCVIDGVECERYQQPDVKAKKKAYIKAYRHKTDKKQTELTFTKQLIKSVEKNLWNLRNKFNRARQTSISNNRLADMAFVIDNEVEHLQNLKYQQESIEKQIAMIRHGQKLGSLTAPNIAISEPHIPSLDEGQTQS